SPNYQGEVQKELDVVSNKIFLSGLCSPEVMACVASEEESYPRRCSDVLCHEGHGGEYAAVFDPLDGSANIEAGLPCGTIFGVLRGTGTCIREGPRAGPSTIMLPGRRLVAAGYCLYGVNTRLVITLGNGVYEFTLDEQLRREGGGWEFLLTKSKIRIPKRGRICSVNEANSSGWSEAIQAYFNDMKKGAGAGVEAGQGDGGGGVYEENPHKLKSEYAGALVADVDNILRKGGVFAYPADLKNPNGKLRLLYEGNPMAMIVEQAGGVATTGFERILEIRPQSVHHRIPAFFGSPRTVAPLFSPRYLQAR
ncbi:unnamed protein product, partial [Discosporangium mesarthrocarpum]